MGKCGKDFSCARWCWLIGTIICLAFVAGCGGDEKSGSQTPPVASFSVSATTGMAPFAVTFTDTSSAGSSAISAWHWDFGDGTTSADRNPVHEYVGAGNYDVSLTVSTNLGSDTAERSNALVIEASTAFIAPTAVATASDPDEGEIQFAANQVLVLLDEGVSQSDFDALVEQAAAIGAIYQALDRDLQIAQFYVENGQELRIRDQLSNEAGVLAAFLNRTETPAQVLNEAEYVARSAPDTLTVPPTIGVSPTTGTTFWWLDDINVEGAWQLLAGDSSLATTSLSVIDTGLPAPQALLDESRVVRIDYLGNTIAGDAEFDPTWPRSWRKTNHGFVVSGFAVGFNDLPGAVVRGVNPNDRLVSVDVLGRGPLDRAFSTDLLTGARLSIINGARVVNISYGLGENRCDDLALVAPYLREFRARFLGLARYAKERDVNLIFGSGNACEKNDDRLFPLLLGVATSERYEDYWVSNVITVGSSDINGRDSCFSVMGDAVDILAPGQGISFTQSPLYNALPSSFDGTSYAAPIVSGAIALVRSTNSSLEAPEAKYVLMRNSRQGLVSFLTEEENEQACASLFGVTPNNRGSAIGPNVQLDLEGAIQGALLTRNVDQILLPEITGLELGEVTSTTISVTVPEQGVRALDLVFLIDQSSSYGDDIDTLQAQANTIIGDLSGRGIDIRYAVAGFSDFPISPYGSSIDREFNLLQDFTANRADVEDAIDLLDQPLLLGGFTFPEGQYEALYQSATTLSYRDGALPVIILATDADFHDSDVESGHPGTGRLETIATLRQQRIQVIGLLSGSSGAAAARLQELASETGGAVFNLDSSSSQIAEAIADAIGAAVQEASISLEVVSGEPWVRNISPTVIQGVEPGETVAFTVEIQGRKYTGDSRFFSPVGYDVHIWARSNGSALIGRYKQSIGP